MSESREPGFSTRAIHAGQDADPATGATVVPIYATSTYTQAAPGQHKGYEYSRSGNPTRTALETCLAALEGGERGLAFASGLAATTAVLSHAASPATRSSRPPTSTAAPSACSNASSSPGAWSPATPTTQPRPASRAIITPKTKLVWIETPTNPLLQILDIAAIAELAHKAGALLAVDNTFASPYLQQPLKLGRRPRRPQHDEVPRRPLRRGRRRGHRPARPAAADRVLPERGRRRAGAVRRLADAARPQDAGGAHGAALRQRPPAGRLAGRAAAGASASTIPACRAIPATSWRSGRCATSAA